MRKVGTIGIVWVLFIAGIIGAMTFGNETVTAQTTLFQDDFEDGNTYDWNTVSSTFTTTASISVESGNLNGDGNYLMQVEVTDDGTNQDDRGQVLLSKSESLNWKDYTFEVDAKINYADSYGYLDFFFYSQSSTNIDNTYWLRLLKVQDRVDLMKVSDGSGDSIDSIGFDVEKGINYHVKIVLNTGNITIYINGQLVINTYDNTFTSGTIGLGTGNAGLESLVRSYFDNAKLVSGTATTGSDNGDDGDETPGFELMTMMIATTLAFALITFSRRRKK